MQAVEERKKKGFPLLVNKKKKKAALADALLAGKKKSPLTPKKKKKEVIARAAPRGKVYRSLLRLDEGLAARLRQQAAAQKVSMNTHIESILQKSLKD